MTRVLVTNDDGIDAPGLHALAAAANRAGYDVTVAAPRVEQSGMSAALVAVTEGGRIVIEPRPVGGLPGFAVDASPAYIALLARIGAFGPPPELVLSGINRGANAGDAVLHSGTVGAALTASYDGARALAVSIDVLHPASGTADSGGAAFAVPEDSALHWDTAAEVAAGLLPVLAAAPPGTVLNLNVPDRPDPPEVRTATLAAFGQVRMAVAEEGEGWVRTTVHRRGEPLLPGTDLALLAEGFATLTAIRPPAEAPMPHLPAQRSRVG